MIRKHDFNSEWLGCKAGIITDINFFSLPKSTQDDLLAQYHWVELRTTEVSSGKSRELHQRGFWQVDTQIKYKFDLTQLPQDFSDNEIEIYRASEKPFLLKEEDICSFVHERFLSLPGVTQKMVDQRYIKMANLVIEAHPEYCFCLLEEDKVQGWFLGTPHGTEITLSLVMKHKNSQLRGKQLYYRAIARYAQEFLLQESRFSITNTPVHNIWAKLGARFLTPEVVWFWINDFGVVQE